MLQKCNIFTLISVTFILEHTFLKFSYSIFSMLVIKKTYYCEK